MTIRGAGLLILFILLTGCATPEAEILSKTESYPPTTGIEVLLDRPARPFKSFAILEDSYGGTPEEINGRLSRKAQQIGADAIIITRINDKAVTEWLMVDPYYNARGVYRPRYRPIRHVYRSVRARAIKYLRE